MGPNNPITVSRIGSMYQARKVSAYYQLQPLQQGSTTWKIRTMCTMHGSETRWINVASNNFHDISGEVTLIYDCDRISRISFDISDFDFNTRVIVLKAPESTPAVVRLSRYQRDPVI
jgi:hypothetical protein